MDKELIDDKITLSKINESLKIINVKHWDKKIGINVILPNKK